MANRWLPLLFPAPAVRSPRPKPPSPGPLVVHVDGREISVTVRRNARAKRYTLRLSPRGDGAVLTIPKRGTLAEAKAFLDRHTGWLAEKTPGTRLAAADGRGTVVPVQGIAHRLESTGSPRGRVRATYDAAGHASHGGRNHLRKLSAVSRGTVPSCRSAIRVSAVS